MLSFADRPYQGVFDAAGNQTRVIFGPNSLDQLPTEVSKHGRRAFLITSKTVNSGTPLVDRVRELLGNDLVGVFSESGSHTPRSRVLAAADLARSAGSDCLISLGGGGATDVAKAVILALWLDIRRPSDFDRAFQQLRSGGDGISSGLAPLPQISLPTTLVAAEHSDGVGITDDSTHQKQVFLSRHIQAAAVILDPELSRYTPQALWLSTGVKGLDHAVAKLSAVQRHPMIDAANTLALQILAPELRRCFDEPENMACRGQLQVGVWLSMFGSGSIPGKMQGISHALGRQIGGVCGASHGLIASVVLPPSIEFNAPASPVGLALVADALGVLGPEMSADEVGHAAAGAIRSLVAHLGLPDRLRDIGVTRDKLEVIADRAMKDVFIGLNPRKISGAGEVLAFLEEIW